MRQLNHKIKTSPRKLLNELATHLKAVVWSLQELSNSLPTQQAQDCSGKTLEQCEIIDNNLAILIGYPSLVAAFAEVLAVHPFGRDELWNYIEEQRSMIRGLKMAPKSHGHCHIEKIKGLTKDIGAVADKKLKQGRPRNPSYDILDQIIIFEAAEFGKRTGGRPTIFLYPITKLPGPFLKRVLAALAARNLEFTYAQIHDRIKPLKAHPVHGTLFG